MMRFPHPSLPILKAPSWQPTVVLLALLGIMVLFIWLVPVHHLLEAFARFLPFHTIIETLTVVVAALIFVMGWQIYIFSRAMNVVLIASVFLAVALLDLGHLMTHPGMPDFISPGTLQETIAFWLAARFIAAIGLFASVATHWKPLSKFHNSYLAAGFFILYTGIAYWLILFHLSALPQTYIDGSGFTPLKILAEYVIVMINTASAVLLLLFMGNRLSDNAFSRNLFVALYIMALSELCFMLNANATDIYSLTGHLLKITAYFFIYKAMLNISIKLPLDQLQKSTNQLEIEKELAQITLKSIGDAVITTDVDGAILFLNPVAESLTGWTLQEAVGLPLEDVFYVVNHATRRPLGNLAYRALRNYVSAAENSNTHSILISKNSGEYTVEFSVSPIQNNEGFILGSVLIFHNITEKNQLMEQIAWQAGHDTLTKLPNRTLLSDRISHAIAHALRQEQLLLVCFMDLDGFKAVNDQHGHDMGDKLLIEVAHRLTNVVRSDDTVSRLGGDEFVLLLSELRSTEEVDILISRILEEMARPFLIDKVTLKISSSVGATIFPFDSSDTDTLLRHADQAMYQAKQSGRNRFHLFDSSMDHQVQEHHLQMARLELALVQNELLLFYQPKVNMKTGKIVGMEALLRWQHPSRGLLRPMDFLHFAEESNLIIDIGNWVLNDALGQIAKWQKAGHNWVVSVNIAARQLQRHDFVSNIQSILSQNPDAPAQKLELEILESTALKDMNHVSSVILACQAMGITISLDDFGSGYSSLAYLRHLPVNSLKIDQSFVHDMLEDEEDCALVEGILQMARVFKRDVIAEGMETAAHGALLLKLGCDTAQGNGIAPPMPASEVLNWAAQFKPDPGWQNYPAALVGWGRTPVDIDAPQTELSL